MHGTMNIKFIGDLIRKIPPSTNFSQPSKFSTNNYIRGPQFLMQYLEILQKGKKFHSLLESCN